MHAFSGVRPLYDDNAENPSAVTRDYIFDIDPKAPGPRTAPMLSVFGGKITTYRKLAEHAPRQACSRPFRSMTGAWTAECHLARRRDSGRRFRPLARRLPSPATTSSRRISRDITARLYGTRAEALLDGAAVIADLGRHFGALLYEREVDFLRRTEWAIDAGETFSTAAPSMACI